jgi:hypothetical protein
VDGLDADIAELNGKLQELIVPFTAAADRLDEITGSAAPPPARSSPRSAPTWVVSPPWPSKCFL